MSAKFSQDLENLCCRKPACKDNKEEENNKLLNEPYHPYLTMKVKCRQNNSKSNATCGTRNAWTSFRRWFQPCKPQKKGKNKKKNKGKKKCKGNSSSHCCNNDDEDDDDDDDDDSSSSTDCSSDDSGRAIGSMAVKFCKGCNETCGEDVIVTRLHNDHVGVDGLYKSCS